MVLSSNDNTTFTNDKMSSTPLLIALKLGFWRKNVIHGTFSSANTSLSNEKMSSTALKARFLKEKYHSRYFFSNDNTWFVDEKYR